MDTQKRGRSWLLVVGFVMGCLIVGWVLAKLWVRNITVEIGKLRVAVTEKENEVWRAVIDTRSKELVWNTFVRTGSVTDVFFPTGKVVMGLVEKSNRPPLFFVHFRDLENATNSLAGTHYYARGPSAHFTRRDVRDATGKVVRRDVWYQEMWHELVVTNRRIGIVLGGEWFPVIFDADGHVKILKGEGPENDSGVVDEPEDLR